MWLQGFLVFGGREGKKRFLWLPGERGRRHMCSDGVGKLGFSGVITVLYDFGLNGSEILVSFSL